MQESDLDLFDVAVTSREGTGAFQWFGHTSLRGLRRAFQEDGLLGKEGGVLAIAVDGRSVGRVEWFAAAWGRPATSSCWTIAIGIGLEHRGSGIGSAAQRLLVDYLWQHTRVERVQAYTDVDNVAERRALEKIGFVLEGVVRCAQWREGGWHDQALYSVLRS